MPLPQGEVHRGMLGSKPAWVKVEGKAGDPKFEEYPDMSLAAWHEAKGL